MTDGPDILAVGMVTGVGLSAAASCAAIRCGLNDFNETAFIDTSGDRIIASEVLLDEPWRGTTRLAKMAAAAIRECLDASPDGRPVPSDIPLVLVVAEEDRPGRLSGLGGPLLLAIEGELGLKFHPDSAVIPQGRVGGAVGLVRAHKLMIERHHAHVVLCGVDSYLTAPTLAGFERQFRLLTAENSDGFVAGEGSAAVLLGNATGAAVRLTCRGFGFAREAATISSGQPLRGDGMLAATRSALASAGITLEGVDAQICDVSGEQYRFKEIALATGRLRRDHRGEFEIWHPADCIGEVGAAALPAMLGVLWFGACKKYLPGPTFLALLSNDDDKRAALVVSGQSAP
jgi:3-oxoacyl-[acyl-carrier-protein] synthase I